MLELAEKKIVPELVRAKNEEKSRRDMLSEKAETLRTRLQLALFKVQSNQTSKPFSRLNRPLACSPKLPPQSLSSSPLLSSPGRHARLTPISPESKIAVARARATMQVKPHVQPLDKCGHPTIVPTAFSARLTRDKPQIPSSPPLTISADATVPIFARTSTPTRPAKSKGIKESAEGIPRTPLQLSSPSRSPEKLSTVGKLKQGKAKYGGGTSSVVRGEAANGLLDLMRRAAGDGDA